MALGTLMFMIHETLSYKVIIIIKLLCPCIKSLPFSYDSDFFL